MPNIEIEGPRLGDMDRKRKLVEKITDAVQEAYGLNREAFVVIIKENAPENIAVGGILLADRSGK